MTKKFTSWRILKKQFKKDCMSPKMKVEFNTDLSVRLPVKLKVIPILELMRESHTQQYHWAKPNLGGAK